MAEVKSMTTKKNHKKGRSKAEKKRKINGIVNSTRTELKKKEMNEGNNITKFHLTFFFLKKKTHS